MKTKGEWDRRPRVSPACLALGLALLLGAELGVPAYASNGSHLVVAHPASPATLNPLYAKSSETHDIINRMFIKLLEEQSDYLTFAPRLASSWRSSDDGLSVTFELRDDVRWHDGVPVTARDVRFSWELHTDTLVAWPSYERKSKIRDVEVIDDRTVVFHFTQRYPYQLMDANDGVILPRHLLGNVPRAELRTHEFGIRPVGNGPYKLKRWEDAQYIELVANDNYYEGPPRIERITFKIVEDEVTRLAQLKSGESDLMEAVGPDHLGELEEDASLRLYRYPSRRMYYISWNTEREPFRDVRVREALTLAIDRQEIVKTVYGGYARECIGPVHPILWAHDSTMEAPAFDPERAREKLAGLGWTGADGDDYLHRNGVTLEFELLTMAGQQRVDMVTMVEANLRAVGIRAIIRVLETKTFYRRVLDKDFDAALIGWGAGTHPALDTEWHSSAAKPNAYNFSSYRNSEVDSLIDEAVATLDMEKAKRLYASAQRKIYYDHPATFIAVPDEVTALRTRFCNVNPNAISFYVNLRYWLTDAECRR